jgi:hypothetical protein
LDEYCFTEWIPWYLYATWRNHANIKEWWMELVMENGRVRKAMAPIIMLVSWAIWK